MKNNDMTKMPFLVKLRRMCHLFDGAIQDDAVEHPWTGQPHVSHITWPRRRGQRENSPFRGWEDIAKHCVIKSCNVLVENDISAQCPMSDEREPQRAQHGPPHCPVSSEVRAPSSVRRCPQRLAGGSGVFTGRCSQSRCAGRPAYRSPSFATVRAGGAFPHVLWAVWPRGRRQS